MLNKIYNGYALLFAKPIFRKWNKFLHGLSIRGLGILNHETEQLRGEYDWLKSYLANIKKPFVIDVGANVGDYTNDVLKINANSEVISIEPHPITFRTLKNNIDSNNVNLYNCAIGIKEDYLELFDYVNTDGSGHASLYKDVITDLRKKNVISYKVEVKVLDNILHNNQTIDLLKIDTEGNELNVLMSAKNTIKKTKAIHFEFNDANIVSRTTFKDFWDLLSNDFYFFRILPNGKLLPILRYNTVECEIYHYQNIICLHKLY